MYKKTVNLRSSQSIRDRVVVRLRRALLRSVGMIVFVASFAGVSSVHAQRLMHVEPYDTIVLKDGTELKVLELKDLDKSRPINCWLESEPDQGRRVDWKYVEKIVFFYDRLLSEARALMKKQEFDKAFESLKFVHDKYPNAPGLDQTVDRLLYSEAVVLFRQGKLERSTLLLDEVFQRDPSRQQVTTALTRVLDAQFKRFISKRNFQSARRLYEISEPKYRRALPALLGRWRAQLEQIGQRVLARGNEHLEAGRFREAYLSSLELKEIWPQTVGLESLKAKASQRYPLIRVGVLDGTNVETVSPVTFSWVQRRRHRLETRDLFELTGVGPDGGEYECLIGQTQFEPNNRAFTISVDASGGAGMTGVELSQLLLDRGDLTLSGGDSAWASLAQRIGAVNLVDAAVELRRPFLRTESLLDIPLSRLNNEAMSKRFAPYTLNSSDENEAQFFISPDYVAASATQPREVIERHFETPLAAVQSLRRGEVDIIDRVFPADISQLRREESIKLVRYRIPSLHVLIPNFDRDYVDNRLFRRGLAYSIDRAKILKRDLLGGSDIEGCQLITGPFSPGIQTDDPIAYGYDRRIDLRPYDPRHAKTLIKLAQVEMAMLAEKNESSLPELTELVIAHPAGEIARIACNEIVEDLSIIGVSATLRVLPPGACRPDDDEWDLLYLDYVMPEPLADAGDLLAFEGFARCRSPHLNLALRQLQQVVSWKEAGERLRVIHQLCYDNTSVIPLWQLADHMAYRDGLQGISREPTTVYQNIEGWTQN